MLQPPRLPIRKLPVPRLPDPAGRVDFVAAPAARVVVAAARECAAARSNFNQRAMRPKPIARKRQRR